MTHAVSPDDIPPHGLEALEAMEGVAPSRALKARVLSAIEAHPVPPRRVESARARLFVGLAVVISLSIYAAWGGVRPTGRPAALVLGTSLGAGAIAALAMWAAVGRGRSMLGRSRSTLALATACGPLALVAWKIYLSAQYAHGLDRWPSRIGLRCLALSLVLATLPMAALLFVRRGTSPAHPGLSGTGMAVAWGLGVAALVDSWCPVAYVPHLLLGHILPIAVLGLLGFWVGRKVLAPQR